MRRGALTAVLGTLVLAAIEALSLVPAAGAIGFPENPFCVPTVLKDYEAPLEGLPKVRHAPRLGRLPFAPGIFFGRDQWSIERDDEGLAVSGRPLRYEVRVPRNRKARPLSLTVDSRLVRISARGRGLSVARHRVDNLVRLGAGGERKLGFAKAPGPGLYRYDLTFERPGDRVLAEYHDYYAIAAEDNDVRIDLDATTVAPGAQLLAKVENFGTDHLFYGVDFSIERDAGGAWEPIDAEAVFGYRLVFIAIGLSLGPGQSDSCSSGFTVPTGMEPGRYRLVKDFDGYPPGTASAEFTVSAGA